jgi:hypothetical protein
MDVYKDSATQYGESEKCVISFATKKWTLRLIGTVGSDIIKTTLFRATERHFDNIFVFTGWKRRILWCGDLQIVR